MHLNCPHCQNPIQIVETSADKEMVCPSCGSTFKLDPYRTRSSVPETMPKLGKFEMLTMVGHGAFGTVYRARDTELDRLVAVKVPHSREFTGRDDEDRFAREARNAAQLRHPGIVPVYEVGRHDGVPFIVSEFVEGVTLADALSARRFGFREAAELLVQIADALDYAHSHGVVHRDLKPSNIMLEAVASDQWPVAREEKKTLASSLTTGRQPLTTARLMDFGLAKRDAGEITMTLEGQVLGTPAYMSPEQARGEGHQVDGRSDIYSLGVILYQLLTGELPFRGTQRMLLQQVLYDDPRSPRSLNDRIPRDLETICLKAMAKEPSRRYDAARKLAADLRRWLTGEPIHARPVSRTEKAWRWCRRNAAVAALTASVILLLLGGTGVSTFFAVEARQEAKRADKEARELEEINRAFLEAARAGDEAKNAERLAAAREAEAQKNATKQKEISGESMDVAKQVVQELAKQEQKFLNAQKSLDMMLEDLTSFAKEFRQQITELNREVREQKDLIHRVEKRSLEEKSKQVFVPHYREHIDHASQLKGVIVIHNPTSFDLSYDVRWQTSGGVWTEWIPRKTRKHLGLWWESCASASRCQIKFYGGDNFSTERIYDLSFKQIPVNYAVVPQDGMAYEFQYIPGTTELTLQRR